MTNFKMHLSQNFLPRISLLAATSLLVLPMAQADEAKSERANQLELRLNEDSHLDKDISDNDKDEQSRHLFRAAAFGAGQLGLQYAAIRVWDPPNWHDFGNSPTVSSKKFVSNFNRTPVFEPDSLGGGGLLGISQADGDTWKTNVVGHGLQGSELYLRMRREGFNLWQAGLGGLMQSTIWEYGVEGMHETPSLWDLVWTPTGGAALGELRYRLLRKAKQHRGQIIWTGLGFLADPVGEIDQELGRWLYKRP